MIAAIVILGIAVVVLLVNHIMYKRQIAEICRRISFINEHKTNMELLSDMDSKELNLLEKEINRLIKKSRSDSLTAYKSETALKETISSLSHDIRTPLTSLDGFFQLLKDADSEEERNQYIDIIQNRINSLKSMLEELFTYTKLQNEEYQLQTAPMDFTQCVTSTIIAFYNDFEEREIDVQADFTEEKITVDCNAEAVQRIVQNILKNVLDHGSKAARMTLKREGERVVFSCANKVDNPEDVDVSKVFTRFYKSDPARTNSSTGLGLAIAKALTERMNGNITAHLDGEWFGISVWFEGI